MSEKIGAFVLGWLLIVVGTPAIVCAIVVSCWCAVQVFCAMSWCLGFGPWIAGG